MGEQNDDHGTGGGVAVAPETRQRLERPRLYHVILHNDNYTTMEFVISILQTIFRKSNAEAMEIMLNVHQKGQGVAGVYPFEIAESKVHRVLSLARENEFPLQCSLEPE